MIRIRKAKPKDATEIANLRRETYKKIHSKDSTKRQLRILMKKNSKKDILRKMKEREMFCLTDKNRILGVVDSEGNKIGGMFIRYNYVRKGLGTRLMKFIEDYAKKKGIKKVKLNSTKYALPFYLKLGYKFKGKNKWKLNGVSFTNYGMEKTLK